MSSGRDFLAIKDVIQRLDQPRRQVFIEALILEVQLSDETRHRHELARRPAGRRRRRARARRRPDAEREVADAVVARVAATGLIGGVIGAPLDELADVPRHEHPVVRRCCSRRSRPRTTRTSCRRRTSSRSTTRRPKFSVGNNIPYQAGLSFGGVGLPARHDRRRDVAVGSIGQNIQREELNLELNVTPHISSERRRCASRSSRTTKDIGEQGPAARPDVDGAQAEDAGRRARSAERRDRRPDPGARHLQRHEGAAARRHPAPRLPVQVHDEDEEEDEPADPAHAVHHQGPARPRSTSASASCASTDEFTRVVREPQRRRSTSRSVDYRRKRGLVEEINRAVEQVEDDAELLNAASASASTCSEGADRVRSRRTIDAPARHATARHAEPKPASRAKPVASARSDRQLGTARAAARRDPRRALQRRAGRDRARARQAARRGRPARRGARARSS